jgi:hypothetical protein
MIEITIKNRETVVTIVVEGDEVSVKQPDQAEPLYLGPEPIQASERPANINDNHTDIQEARNDEFVRQFAEKLGGNPVYGDAVPELVTESVLDAVNEVAELEEKDNEK